jgi:hypothetical protein
MNFLRKKRREASEESVQDEGGSILRMGHSTPFINATNTSSNMSVSIGKQENENEQKNGNKEDTGEENNEGEANT